MVDEKLRSRHQFMVFVGLFVGYSLYVCCRKDFSFVIPVLSDEMTKQDMGFIISLQSAAYAISKFGAGVFSDHVSARLLFFIGLVGASFSVLGFSFVHSTLLYGLFWFLNGLSQGCGWPACSKLLRQWFPPEQFGTYWSLLAGSNNVGGGVIPIFLPFLLFWIGGWRNFMLATSIVSLIWSGLFLACVRNRPEDVGLKPVDHFGKKNDTEKEKRISWTNLMNNRTLWLVSLYYFVILAVRTSCENWAQLLLVKEKDFTEGQAGIFISCVEIGGFLSSLFTGYLTDWMIVRQSITTKSNPRLTVALFYMMGAVFTIHIIVSTSVLTQFCGFLLGACLYGNINIYGIVVTEAAPSYLSGTSHAIASLAANLGAIAAGYPLSLVANKYGWSGVFHFLELGCILCVVCKLITRNIGLETKEKQG